MPENLVLLVHKKKLFEENEMKKFVKLMESELERAEILLASRSIVDDLQGMIESVSKMKVEHLSPLVDRIKAEFGLETADQFNQAVSNHLDTALDTLTDVKDSIDTESLKISGDVDSDVETDFGDDDSGGDEFNLGDELGVEDNAETDFDFGDDSGRELKESITIEVQTVRGKVGKKVFESRKAMRTWLNEHDTKIKKVLKISKAK